MLELGVTKILEIGSFSRETWILMDDAQIGFEADLFWITIFKDLASGIYSDKIRIVIAATYDLVNHPMPLRITVIFTTSS